MLILRRPSSSAKCGMSQEMGSTASRVAWGRMNRLPPVVSSSTILVTVTSPICHRIVALPCQRRAYRRCEGRARAHACPWEDQARAVGGEVLSGVDLTGADAAQ